jgi:hypothetical protein
LHSSAQCLNFSGETIEEKTARELTNKAEKVAEMVKHDARSFALKNLVRDHKIKFLLQAKKPMKH